MDSYKEKVKELIHDIEEYEDFEDDTDLLQKGIMKSLCFMYVVTELEHEYGFTFPEDELDIKNFDTVEHIAKLVKSLVDSK
ncbi:phosphopantetheine-binding protein [Schwartzia succinivorans]|jgi:acyl carrier protein|uniref:Phosphopantetheine attachment site n=1 Tax=Schwartzia succinivorans DSM 10502 TaxID=1123243 RepID=A0A1M4XQ58_9FIRM|nr:phosphopantetheine-binding protein [Schwartzia succinivorans]SHE95560.1 Phosphopantetheine attachment site [Schwartzia succinivorans DSM 10502]